MTSFPSLIVILLADGFDEAEAGLFIGRLRAFGLAVQAVGLSLHPVIGAQGLTLKLDSSLETISHTLKRTLAVIIPGGAAHIARLQADPRIHDLLHQVLEQGGHIVTTPGSDILLSNAGLCSHVDWVEDREAIIQFKGAGYLEAFISDLGRYLLKRCSA